MSRSIFALKFRETVGTSPMEYLTRWRMLLAGHRLTDCEEACFADWALSLAFESEGAFSRAFKRVMAVRHGNIARGAEVGASIK
jgi:AraC-like DNA-binding protein